MSEFKVGDKVCFKSCELPQFYGGVYEVLGQTIAGIFNDEVVLEDGLNKRRIAIRMLRKAKDVELEAGFRENTEGFDLYWYGEKLGDAIKAHELLGDELIQGGAVFVGNNSNIVQMINDLGDDFPIENHISPNCKAKDV